MAGTVSGFLIERLHEWGVRRIFGYPGDGINGIIAAIDAHHKAHANAADAIDFVQVRHEEQAAFMACAHAKFTGELGVCLATQRSRCDPSAQRALRRQGRSRAGAGADRSSRDDRDR
jgi:glyoxylate carboligase